MVTARRAEEPAGETPMSVAALGADELSRLGADNLADIARAVPNFTLAPTGVLGVATPAIRGIFSPAGSSTVGLYVDDVPIQIRSIGFSRNVDLRTFDLERVEVMRGPQGTLFGANSMGGTIRFITRMPSLSQADASASAELAFTGQGEPSHELRGAAGGPIVRDRLGWRLALYGRTDGGYVDRIDRATGETRARDVDDVTAIALRASLKAKLGERIELVPALFFQRVEQGDQPFHDSDLGPYRQGNVHAQPAEDEFVLPSLTARIDFGGARLSSIAAFLDRRDRLVTDYSLVFGELVLGGAVPGLVPPGGARSFTRVAQRGFTQEVHLESTDGAAPVRWLAGLFYRDAELDFIQEVVEPGITGLVERYFGATIEQLFGVPLLPGGISYRGTERATERQFAGFGEVAWRPADNIEASAGLRIARSELDLRVLSEGPYAGGALTEPADRTQRETPVTPQFALSYRPAPHRLIYVSVGKGFRVGGANPPVPTANCAEDLAAFGLSEAPLSYDSDRLWNYEAGFKASLPSRGLRLSVSAFRIDWGGIQQPVTLPNCGFSFVDNLGTARNHGFEAEVQARLLPGLELRAGLGFVDARFRGDILGGPSGAGGQPAVIVEKGDRVPFVPRWTGRIGAEYRTAVARAQEFSVGVEYQFAGAYWRAPSQVSVGYDPRTFRGEAYGNLLVRIGLDWGRWRISAFGENLLGDRSVLFSSAEFVPVTGSPLRRSTLRPRTIGLQVAVRR